MDSDLWISRLAAAKRHYSTRHRQNLQPDWNFLDRLSIDEFEMEEEEEVRPDFPCPYCYEDHDITSLCFHLEEEHAFESKAAVCPICSTRVAKDMLNHITLQHRHILKLQRRQRFHRFTMPSGQTLSLLRRDLREAHLQVLLGSTGYRSNNNEESNITADSFLSSFLLNFPTSDADETLKPTADENLYRRKESHVPAWKSSLNSSLTQEQREQRRKQATIRATFMQDLLLSTLFGDQMS
ncbi:hypothetical protein MUK42_32403 [Musa troglodytarum]|uniref:Uncharacterized protein n=1 Tax=Musa troglodytarum TaxID=320322 RepID=A0A9E7FKE3_9LILI|nr:hypothetical protein MUK42_32403 [Musa troglodytarum]